MNNPLIEFLFVDKRRLNSYFYQIETPVVYDRVPVWDAEFGFPSGVKTKGSQEKKARQWTTYEKVEKLVKFLKKNNLLKYEREKQKVGGDGVTEFRFEICDARKAFIPPDSSSFAAFKGLNIWIAPCLRLPEPNPGMLFLIEDFQNPDMPHVDTKPSGYSALLTIFAEMKESIRQTIIGNQIDDKLAISLESAAGEFAIDPIGFLTDLGARVSEVRKIQTLYRMRATLLDCSPCSSDKLSQFRDTDWDIRRGVTTVGYPILIVEGGSPAIVKQMDA